MTSKLRLLGDQREVQIDISRVDRARFGGPDWNTWRDAVVAKCNAGVCTEIMVGMATQDVIHGFLNIKKPVYLYMLNFPEPVGVFRRVTGVASINPDDWQAGWMLTIETPK